MGQTSLVSTPSMKKSSTPEAKDLEARDRSGKGDQGSLAQVDRVGIYQASRAASRRQELSKSTSRCLQVRIREPTLGSMRLMVITLLSLLLKSTLSATTSLTPNPATPHQRVGK